MRKENNIFAEKDKNFERRSHGCDGCRKGTPTERFDGYCGGHLWICKQCYKKIVSRGINTPKSQKEKSK